MKKKKDYQKFADELKRLCEKHGIGIIGTCESEGIFGEITLYDLKDPENSINWIEVKSNSISFEVKQSKRKNWHTNKIKYINNFYLN